MRSGIEFYEYSLGTLGSDKKIKDKGNARGNGLTIYYTNDARTM